MAEKQYIVETKFTADTEEFKQGVDEVKGKIGELGNKLDEIGNDPASSAIGDAAKKLGDLKGAAEKIAPAANAAVGGLGKLASGATTTGAAAAVSGTAVLGWFVALTSLASGLLIAGKAIANWLRGINEARRTMIEMRRRVDDANDAINESGAAAAGSITKFKLLAQQWDQLTPEDKVAEFEEYQRALKKIGIEVTNINDADNVFINNSQRVIEALIARARAAGAEKIIADAESEKLLKEVEKEKAQERLKEVEELEKALGGIQGRLAVSSTDLGTNKSPFAEEIDRLNKSITDADKEIDKHDEFISKIGEKYLEAAEKAKILGEFASEAAEEVEETTENTAESVDEILEALEGSIAKYNEALKTARENYNNAATDEMRQYYAAEIAGIEQTIAALNREAEAYLAVQKRRALGTLAPTTAGVSVDSIIGADTKMSPLDPSTSPLAQALQAQHQAVIEANLAMQEEAEQWNETINSMFGYAVADSISGGIEAITDAIMGIGDIDATSVVDAFLSPFADMSVRLGEMMVAMGVAESAFLSGFNPAQKIAAGAALIALGKLYKSAVESAGNRANGDAGYGYGNTWSGGGQLAAATNTPVQIEVYGTLSGQDIVLAGNNYTNNQRR